MLVSLNFIEKFITLPRINQDFDVETISSILTRQGFEVEGTRIHGQGLDNVVVGRIEDAKPHPSADKLQVCSVNVGASAPSQIVCGASNARAGLYVAVALPEAKLPNGLEIKSASLRGVESHGMLCSRQELGLPVNPEVDGDGIWELDLDVQGGKSKDILSQKLGHPVFSALDLHDVLVDISVTPNRPDMLCHEGVARELEAGFSFLKIPYSKKNPFFSKDDSMLTEQKIQNDASQNASVRCQNLTFTVKNHIDASTFFVVLETDQVGYSPAWLRNLLETLGQNSINQVVDVSNYVLLAYGQPNHPFDLDKIGLPDSLEKNLTIRHAKPNEHFLGLDGKERQLHELDCVVSDDENVHALLGVLGGMQGKVDLSANKIAIEFANPNPVLIRRTSRKHGRQTEASFLFEKGIDVAARFRAASEFVSLLNSLCEQKVHYTGALHSQNLEAFPVIQTEFHPKLIPLHCKDQGKILGTEISNFETQIEILKSLSFQVTNKTDQSVVVQVPSWRLNDVACAADLVEECIRVVGIDHVPARPIEGSFVVNPDDKHFSFLEKICARATALGYQEVIGLHFMRADDWQKMNLNSPTDLGLPVVLLNPILGDEPLMHTTLIPDLLRKVARNLNFGIKNGQLFHSCRTFQNADDKGQLVFQDLPSGASLSHQENKLFEYAPQQGYSYCKQLVDVRRPVETPRLAGVCFGVRVEKNWQNQGEIPWTLHDMMSHVMSLAAVAGIVLHVTELEKNHPISPALHPGKRVAFSVQSENASKTFVGWCGEFHPKVLRDYDIAAACFGFEINMSALIACQSTTETSNKRQDVGQRLPAISRDFAFVLDESVTSKVLTGVVIDSIGKILEQEIPARVCEVKIFDVYRGKGVDLGKKSVAFKVVLEPLQKTFTDAQIQKISAQITQAVQSSFGGSLR